MRTCGPATERKTQKIKNDPQHKKESPTYLSDTPHPSSNTKFSLSGYFSISCCSLGKKKSTKINFLGPETTRWGGGLPREGVVAEKFEPSLESLSSLSCEGRKLGCPGNFAGMSQTLVGVQKVSANKKNRVHFSISSLSIKFAYFLEISYFKLEISCL